MPWRTLKVWLVDDDDYEVFVMDRMAHREQEYRILLTSFLSARQAMAALQSTPPEQLPEVILCDVKMPDMDGFEFLEWLRRSPYRTIPCVMRSNSGLQKDVNRAYHMGANAYHVKPATNDALAVRIRAFVAYWCQCKHPNFAADAA